MALFSDVDWIIVVGVVVFLLWGRGNGELLRTLGRWYGRAGRLTQELLGELRRAADLPESMPEGRLSLRGTLLGFDPVPTQTSGVPAAVRTAPAPAPAATPLALAPGSTSGYPVATWSTAVAGLPHDREGSR